MSNCLFCRIAAGEIPATIVHESEHLIAFLDINPQAPTHILVIPRKHIPTLDQLEDDHTLLVGQMIQEARYIAGNEGLSGGYRLVFNCCKDGGQEVDHIHLHLLGGRSMQWPPG